MTVDWAVKETAQARLRVLVKRILRRYGCLPDKQENETVLEQAELLGCQSTARMRGATIAVSVCGGGEDMWHGGIIGEIQRGPGQQQVVMPPSIHPATGARYRWVTESLGCLCEPVNPVTDDLPKLPGLWLAYLRSYVYR